MIGHVQRRGRNSWRLKFDLGKDPLTGKRKTRYETIRCRTKREAADALAERKTAARKNELVDPSALTVAAYLRSWLEAPGGISPKTAERYGQLAEQQIIPHLGAIALQKLTAGDIQDWHDKLKNSGGKGGRNLSARTVGHAHRLLHRTLARAVVGQKVFRNVASLVEAPKVEDKEIETLTAPQIAETLVKLAGHPFYSIVVTALGTGARRGEILALPWCNIDLDGASLRIERSLEETKAGLRFKPPKSRHGRRSVSLPSSVVDALRAHRREQLELRVAQGLGKLPDDALVFCQLDGSPMSPDKLSRDWSRLVVGRKLPKVSFHALRHSHVSALIAAGLDVFSISRRIGHGDAALTLRTYTHMFSKKDSAAAAAIDAALRAQPEQ